MAARGLLTILSVPCAGVRDYAAVQCQFGKFAEVRTFRAERDALRNRLS
jgi:hypothetical protein